MSQPKINSKTPGLDPVTRAELLELETEERLKRLEERAAILDMRTKDLALIDNGLASRLWKLESEALAPQPKKTLLEKIKGLF